MPLDGGGPDATSSNSILGEDHPAKSRRELGASGVRGYRGLAIRGRLLGVFLGGSLFGFDSGVKLIDGGGDVVAVHDEWRAEESD